SLARHPCRGSIRTVSRCEREITVAAAFNPMKETPETVGTLFRPSREDPRSDVEGEARRPRDLVDRPEMFGLWGKPMRAAPGFDPADAAFIAANVQHWVANAIREEVAMSMSNLATLLPTLEDRKSTRLNSS